MYGCMSQKHVVLRLLAFVSHVCMYTCVYIILSLYKDMISVQSMYVDSVQLVILHLFHSIPYLVHHMPITKH